MAYESQSVSTLPGNSSSYDSLALAAYLLTNNWLAMAYLAFYTPTVRTKPTPDFHACLALLVGLLITRVANLFSFSSLL